MKKIAHIGIALVLGLPMVSTMAADPHAAHMAGAAPAGKATMSEGEVKKIDKEGRKITIKHGPIANLNMPPMTMIFPVKDVVQLDGIKAGDKIRFVAAKKGAGLHVTHLEVAK